MMNNTCYYGKISFMRKHFLKKIAVFIVYLAQSYREYLDI